jgi:hypothetical protein
MHKTDVRISPYLLRPRRTYEEATRERAKPVERVTRPDPTPGPEPDDRG